MRLIMGGEPLSWFILGNSGDVEGFRENNRTLSTIEHKFCVQVQHIIVTHTPCASLQQLYVLILRTSQPSLVIYQLAHSVKQLTIPIVARVHKNGYS